MKKIIILLLIISIMSANLAPVSVASTSSIPTDPPLINVYDNGLFTFTTFPGGNSGYTYLLITADNKAVNLYKNNLIQEMKLHSGSNYVNGTSGQVLTEYVNSEDTFSAQSWYSQSQYCEATKGCTTALGIVVYSNQPLKDIPRGEVIAVPNAGKVGLVADITYCDPSKSKCKLVDIKINDTNSSSTDSNKYLLAPVRCFRWTVCPYFVHISEDSSKKGYIETTTDVNNGVNSLWQPDLFTAVYHNYYDKSNQNKPTALVKVDALKNAKDAAISQWFIPNTPGSQTINDSINNLITRQTTTESSTLSAY